MIDRQDFAGALNCYTKAVDICPDSPEYLIQKSFCLLPLNQYKEALKCVNEAIIHDPNHANAYQLKGECLFELKDYQESIEAFSKAIELDPLLESISYNLSIAKVINKYTYIYQRT